MTASTATSTGAAAAAHPRPLRDRILALVEEDRVHRDLYLSDEIFALEQRHFLANTWTYLGHASQVPEAGDYVTVDLAGRPLVMVRQPDGTVRVLFNRCAHKGTQLVTERAATSAATSAARTTPGPTSSTARRSACR